MCEFTPVYRSPRTSATATSLCQSSSSRPGTTQSSTTTARTRCWPVSRTSASRRSLPGSPGSSPTTRNRSWSELESKYFPTSVQKKRIIRFFQHRGQQGSRPRSLLHCRDRRRVQARKVLRQHQRIQVPVKKVDLKTVKNALN